MATLQNLVLVTLDCVRRESLSCYPEKFPLRHRLLARWGTPHIDGLARDGVRFDQAVCQAPYTPASHASILTGLNPFNHDIRGMIGYKLNPDAKTMAEILKERGYRCGAFVGSHALGGEYGLNRGFETYDEDFEVKRRNWVLGHQRYCDEVTDRALAWLGRKGGDKFFVFLHYFDAHDRNGRDPDRAYQLRQARRIDRQIGRLLRHLSRERLYDSALIVVTSDHGDSFGEHGEATHREYLYDTTLRVPLVIKATPELAGRVVTRQVRSIDIAPTVLELLEIKGGESSGFDGTSLVSLAAGRDQRDLFAYSETCHETKEGQWQDLKTSYCALRTPEHKLVFDRLRKTCHLYDLRNDPGERRDIAETRPDVVEELRGKLLLMTDSRGRPRPTMTDEEMEIVEERLKHLGYLD